MARELESAWMGDLAKRRQCVAIAKAVQRRGFGACSTWRVAQALADEGVSSVGDDLSHAVFIVERAMLRGLTPKQRQAVERARQRASITEADPDGGA